VESLFQGETAFQLQWQFRRQKIERRKTAMSFFTPERWDSDGGALLDPMRRETEESAPGCWGALPAWYAIQLRPRFEKKAGSILQSKGIETYLPLVKQTHRWSDRRKVIESPLFPGYGFVRLQMTKKDRLQVLQTQGVIGFVGTAHSAVAVSEQQIETLQKLLGNETSFSIHPFLKTGQRIRIRGGALDGVEGILSENGNRRLVISIECIQRAVSITLENYEIEAA